MNRLASVTVSHKNLYLSFLYISRNVNSKGTFLTG